MERKRIGAAPGAFGTLMRSGAIGGLNDEELLDRFVARRDEDAFSALVERHGPMVRRVCRSHLADEHDAGDAYQATFLILAKRAGSIRLGRSLSPWLFGVARRVALKVRWDEQRRRSHEHEAAARRGIEAPAAPEYMPEVMEEVDRLPDRLRTAVILCDLQGKSYESAARVIGCPVRTVHSRLRTARDRLRRRLTRRGLAPGLAVGGSLFGSASMGSGAFCSAATSAAALSRVAVGISVGNRVLAGAVSASVGSLTNWGIKVMMFQKAAIAGTACLVLGGAIGFGPVLARVGLPGDGIGDGPAAVAAIDGEVAGVPRAAPNEPEPPAVVQDAPAAVPEPDSPVEIGSDVHQGPDVPPSGTDQTPSPFFTDEPAQAPQEPPFQFKEPTPIPRPWETVVRITVKDRGSLGYGSGTVIKSNPEEALILTCAHIFQVKGRQPRPEQFNLPVLVELFDGKLGGPGGQTVRPLGPPKPGEVVNYDFDRDLALIRIHPGRTLKSSPIAPIFWQPREGLPMITAGCTHGNDPTVWNTTIIDPSARYRIPGKINYSGILCRYSPRQGRSGGGLFTEEGYLAGIFNFAFDSQVDMGLYANADSIREFLAESRPELFDQAAGEATSERLASRNEGTSVFPLSVEPPARDEQPFTAPPLTSGIPMPETQPQPLPQPSAPSDDRLDRIEQRLDQLIDSLAGGSEGPAREFDFDSYRPKLLELLKRGPIRLVFAEPFEATLLLKSAEDIEQTESILRAMFGQGSPILIEREPATATPPSENLDLEPLPSGLLD